MAYNWDMGSIVKLYLYYSNKITINSFCVWLSMDCNNAELKIYEMQVKSKLIQTKHSKWLFFQLLFLAHSFLMKVFLFLELYEKWCNLSKIYLCIKGLFAIN